MSDFGHEMGDRLCGACGGSMARHKPDCSVGQRIDRAAATINRLASDAPVVGHVAPATTLVDRMLTSHKAQMAARDEDDQEPALDALPEDPPDKQERWKAPRSGLAAAAAEVDRAVEANALAAYREDRAFVVAQLESAAIRLRDAELAKKQALADYQQALNNFNAFVAPVT